MMQELPLAALIGIDDVADILDIPPVLARAYLAGKDEPPVATYHGCPLWLADVMHDIVLDIAAGE